MSKGSYKKGQKSPGFCPRCNVETEWYEKYLWGHKPKNCRNPPFCVIHDVFGHAPTTKCRRFCVYCRHHGHTMQFCHKLRNCDLCGQLGHNPKRCWRYYSIKQWMCRAEALGRCGECLTLFKADEAEICTNCHTYRKYWHPGHNWKSQNGVNCKGSQTETHDNREQELQNELLLVTEHFMNAQRRIDDLKEQIENLNIKIADLETKLEDSKTAMNELNFQLQNAQEGKEQELKKVNTFDSLCKEKEVELKKLKELISQKDTELEQHRKISVQTSQSIPAKAQKPCSNPTPTSSHLEHINEPNIKAAFKNLQDQQQKISVAVNYLCNIIKTQDMLWQNQLSFNPYLGPYDTGQYFK